MCHKCTAEKNYGRLCIFSAILASFIAHINHCYKQMTDKQNKYFQASLSVNNG